MDHAADGHPRRRRSAATRSLNPPVSMMAFVYLVAFAGHRARRVPAHAGLQGARRSRRANGSSICDRRARRSCSACSCSESCSRAASRSIYADRVLGDRDRRAEGHLRVQGEEPVRADGRQVLGAALTASLPADPGSRPARFRRARAGDAAAEQAAAEERALEAALAVHAAAAEAGGLARGVQARDRLARAVEHAARRGRSAGRPCSCG